MTKQRNKWLPRFVPRFHYQDLVVYAENYIYQGKLLCHIVYIVVLISVDLSMDAAKP